jgi:hypothetical protein
MLRAHYIKDSQGKLVQIWEDESVSKQIGSSVVPAKAILKVLPKKSIAS